MPVVSVAIGSRQFQLACGEGQEGYVRSLADKLTQRIRRLSAEVNTTNESLLLAMAAMMAEDELLQQKQKVVPEKTTDTDAVLAEALHNISAYVEAIADRLDSV